MALVKKKFSLRYGSSSIDMLEVDYTTTSVCQDPLYARSPEFTIAD